MNCTDAQNLFNQYVDSELGPEEIKMLEEHLSTCSACSESLDQLRALIGRAESMPTVITPRRDLWPGIRDQIEEEMAKTTVYRVGIGRVGWPVRSMVTVAAAIVVVFASVIAVRFFSDGLDSLERFTAEWSQGLVTLAAMERQYMGVTQDLVYSMGGNERNMPEPAREVIREHLEMIENAIADSRAAAVENPSDAELQSLLSTVYRRKVELLQWTAQISIRM